MPCGAGLLPACYVQSWPAADALARLGVGSRWLPVAGEKSALDFLYACLAFTMAALKCWHSGMVYSPTRLASCPSPWLS